MNDKEAPVEKRVYAFIAVIIVGVAGLVFTLAQIVSSIHFGR